jgi:small subunit ribosomal protein S3
MGQKINPIGFRLALNRNWSSRWYANTKNFSSMLLDDIKVRDYLKSRLAHAAVSKVVIERPAKNARITVFSARPGVVIGKKGEDIESLKVELQKMLGVPVHVNIEEVRKPELDAQLIADSIAQQLQKRIMFRRAMKRAITNAMRLGAQGIKIMSAGRLNGIEIARTEWYREGRVPLHTMRAEIDYGVSEAKTSYGVIGIKVWVFKGEVMQKNEQPVVAPAVSATLAPTAAGPAPAPSVPAPAAPAPATDKPKKPRRAPAKPRAGAKNAATGKT